ncbi:MAG: histidine phosphatase family protein [Oscillospiraceae bacterium]|nr:histidine phosphatase family protein [Oscillospiraceae bacterium]
MVTRIYLVRHAEAEGNVKEFFQGNIDTQLTEKGTQQLECLSARFKDVPFEAVYASPLRRAILTAEAVNRYHHLPLSPEYELREINGGRWEGKKWADFPSLNPEQYLHWTNDMWHFCAPDGEAMTEVYDRMIQVMGRIARENEGRTVAVISHGCAVRNFLAYVESGTIEGLPAVGWSDNTAVSLMEYDCEKDSWKLIFKNDASHLPEELSTLRKSNWNQYEKESK